MLFSEADNTNIMSWSKSYVPIYLLKILSFQRKFFYFFK